MQYDIAIIGGGPAGIMAAITAAQKGASVVLLEKNDRLGKKLLMTGKGRCNLTTPPKETRSFIDRLGKNGKFFYSALNQFDVETTINFFEKNGLETKIENNKVFPKSDKAGDVLKLLEELMATNKVTIKINSAATEIVAKNNKVLSIKTADEEIKAKNYVITTGGLSYPSTGSTGDGYRLAEKLGHTIIEPRPALVGLTLDEDWLAETPGVELKELTFAVYQDNKKKLETKGEALFTHIGINGPAVLDLSKETGTLLKKGTASLYIDLQPEHDHQQLDQLLQKELQTLNTKAIKYLLDNFAPKRLRPVIINIAGIDSEKKANEITKEERKKLVQLLKEFKLKIKELESIEKATITAGGIYLKEIDPTTMCSKIVENLFFAGEVIDLDAPTGGFNLQICWSTGYTAGKGAANAIM
jgi:predicted Rossmann fold flavoprotein